MIQRIAITGGPGTGKSSLIDALRKEGYSCFEEFSRTVIQESLDTNSDVLPWKNLPAFSEAVFHARVEQYHSPARSGLYFYDRTTIDSIAYLQMRDSSIPHEWLNWIAEHRYHQRAFITPPWPEIYTQDEERMETLEEMQELHEQLMHTYASHGYEMIEVPRLSIEERVSWIKGQL